MSTNTEINFNKGRFSKLFQSNIGCNNVDIREQNLNVRNAVINVNIYDSNYNSGRTRKQAYDYSQNETVHEMFQPTSSKKRRMTLEYNDIEINPNTNIFDKKKASIFIINSIDFKQEYDNKNLSQLTVKTLKQYTDKNEINTKGLLKAQIISAIKQDIQLNCLVKKKNTNQKRVRRSPRLNKNTNNKVEEDCEDDADSRKKNKKKHKKHKKRRSLNTNTNNKNEKHLVCVDVEDLNKKNIQFQQICDELNKLRQQNNEILSKYEDNIKLSTGNAKLLINLIQKQLEKEKQNIELTEKLNNFESKHKITIKQLEEKIQLLTKQNDELLYEYNNNNVFAHNDDKQHDKRLNDINQRENIQKGDIPVQVNQCHQENSNHDHDHGIEEDGLHN